MKNNLRWAGITGILAAALVQGAIQTSPAPPMPTAAAAVRGPAPEAAPGPGIAFEQLPFKAVTLNLRDQPLRVALQQLHDQSGLQISINARGPMPGDPGEKHVTIEVKDKPLMETLLALLKQAELDDPIALTMGLPGSGNYYLAGRAFAKGPFLVIARSISHDAPVQPSGVLANQPTPVRLELQVAFDPALKISRINQQSAPARATDEKGNSLIWTQPVNTGMMSFGTQAFSAPNVAILLQYPPPTVEAGHKIAVLEGVISGTVTSNDTFEVGGDKKGERTVGTGGGIKLSVDWGTPADIAAIAPARGRGGFSNAAFAATARFEADSTISATEWNTWQNQTSSTRVTLYDAAGHALRPLGSSSTGSNRSRQMTWYFNTDGMPDGRGGMIAFGEPVKAVVEYPVSARTIDIPYHFENIPLP